MCCFVEPVQFVEDTRIFARFTGDRQVLVYQMKFGSKRDTAMILPLPVRKGTGEDDVEFINLEAYPGFFADLETLFVEPIYVASPGSADAAVGSRPLRVVDVGAFEASFVPSVSDFGRLDARFRLPKAFWDAFPTYQDYGFAVFKLKKGAAQEVHPMALTFPSAMTQRCFFPTVHVHDRKVHPFAEFQHHLFVQRDEHPAERRVRYQKKIPDGGWFKQRYRYELEQRSVGWKRGESVGKTMKMEKCPGVLDPAAPIFKTKLRGSYINKDIVV